MVDNKSNSRKRRSSNDLKQLFLFDVDTAVDLLLLTPDDIFDRVDEKLLTQLNEDHRIERKPATFSGQSLGEYICMWANTQPHGGIVVLGMKDKGGFEGCAKLSADQLNKVNKVGEIYCPDARIKLKRVMVTNSNGDPDFVILLRIAPHPSRVARTTSGKVFTRIGDSKTELSPEAIHELKGEKGEISFEIQDSGLIFPDDFNLSEVNSFISKARKRNSIPDTHTDEEVLQLRRLGRIKEDHFIPNFAMAVIFANDPLKIVPGCKIRFQRFEGDKERSGDKYNAVKDIMIEGRVPDLIRRAESIIDAQIRTFSPLNTEGKFFPVPEYPKEAWLEAIVNACVHRSYGEGMRNMPIFVKMFDDRIEIESPGPFPPFVTPENIYNMHQPRNPQLMDAMRHLDYVLCAHEGTRRIRDSMSEMKLPGPEFKQTHFGHACVIVTLRNNIRNRRGWIDEDVGRLVGASIVADLTVNEKRILNWVASHGSITISDTNKLLEISWQSAKKMLLSLASRRILQYIRFRSYKKDSRDPKAFFRLPSTDALPEGAFHQDHFDST